MKWRDLEISEEELVEIIKNKCGYFVNDFIKNGIPIYRNGSQPNATNVLNKVNRNFRNFNMTFEQLMEGLPDDWDKSVYQHPTSFKNMIAYAKERAEQVGRGSSRVAFKIIYQGRPTALKINLTRKGVAQTQAEVNLLADTYLRNSPIIIPLIDYDTQNSAPTWIHTDFAEKITKRQLESLFNNVPMDRIIRYLRKVRGEQGYDNSTLPEEIFQNENFVEFQDLILNFTNIALGDLERKANWGLYKGRPVIIDLGITKEVYAEFYRK